MIGSTAIDLPEYREVAKEVCLEAGFHPIMMEHLPASDTDAIAISKQLVDDADLYIGIFAHRYGHIPAGHQRSISEIEYDHAIDRNKSRIVFLVQEDYPFPPSMIDEGEKREKLNTFKRQKIGEDRCAVFFASPDDFRHKLATAIWSHKHHGRVPVFIDHRLVPNDPFFIGRCDEIAEIKCILSLETQRLLTILGPAGVGKTELAIHLGLELLNEFKNNALMVNVGTAETIDGVCVCIADALNATLIGDAKKNTQQIADILFSRGRMLLILDNFEQVVDVANATIGTWLRSCGELLVVVTSRRSLEIAGEYQYRLPPLDPPEEGDTTFEELRENESIQVFREHAKRRDHGFEITPRNVGTIAKICEEVEYHPFSIRVVAARISTHEPQEMLEELETLKKEAWPPLELSYKRLAPHVQLALKQLTVFRDGFDRKAVHAVVDITSIETNDDVIEIVDALISHCFIKSTPSATGKRRFSFYHRSVMEFAQAKWLAEQTEIREHIQTRLLNYYRVYAQSWSEQIDSPTSREALDHLIQERENLLEVQRWAIHSRNDEAAAEIAINLTPAFRIRGPVGVAITRLQDTLSACSSITNVQKAQLLIELGHANWMVGNWEQSKNNASEASELAQRANDEPTLAQALELQGLMLYYDDRWEEAGSVFKHAIALAQKHGDHRSRASLLRSLALCGQHKNTYADTIAICDDAERSARIVGAPGEIAKILNTRGLLQWRAGKASAAVASFRAAEKLNQDLGDRMWVGGNLTNIALALTDLGEFDAALECCKDAEALHRFIGNTAWIAVNSCAEGRALLFMGKMETALTKLAAAEEHSSAVGYKESESLCALLRGHALFELGRLEESLVAIQKAIEYHVGNRHEHSPRASSAYVLKAAVCERLGDQEGFMASLKKIADLDHIVEIDRQSESIVFQTYLSLFTRLKSSFGSDT